MVEAGAQMITVHGRTRTQGFSRQERSRDHPRVRDAVPAHIPVVGNGDVVDVEGYRACARDRLRRGDDRPRRAWATRGCSRACARLAPAARSRAADARRARRVFAATSS
jgi:hypothetical protein